MSKITFQTELPDSMLHEFLQYLRDFEQRSPATIHMQQWVEAPDLNLDQMLDAMDVSPGLPIRKVFPMS